MMIAKLSILAVILTLLGGSIYLFLQGGGMGYIISFLMLVTACYTAEDFYRSEQKSQMYVVTTDGNWKPVKGDDTRWK